MSPHDSPRTAAFYDLDGTLADSNLVEVLLFYALREPTLVDAARRLGGMLARAPVWQLLDRRDRRRFNEAFYRSFRGISRDRLEVLAGDLVSELREQRTTTEAAELIDGDRRAGRLTVLVTGSLDCVAEPLARHLGIEHVAANRLVFDRRGLATGELSPPVLAGTGKADFLRAFAAEHQVDLAASRAYSDDGADLPMLSAIGRPIAVNPKPDLARVAAAHGWTVIRLGSPRPTRLLDRALDGGLSLARHLESGLQRLRRND